MKILPEDVCHFFCPCCQLHDRHYETWIVKWVADIRFLQNMFKRINLCHTVTNRSKLNLRVWAILFYLGVSIPIISHVSYYKGKKVLE